MAKIALSGSSLTVADVAALATGADLVVAPDALARMARARAVIDDAVASGKPVYGVTTGLGPRVVETVDGPALERFAVTTVRGRAHSAGADLAERVCRAALAVRLNTLLIGAAGARPALAETLAQWVSAGIAPAIRGAGSIGAADLMWGGDFGLAIIGEGRVWSGGAVMPAADALQAAKIAPYAPGPREGLALVSHSSPSAAIAALVAHDGRAAFEAAQTAAALSMEGFRANLSILDPDLLTLRPQAGQLKAAEGLGARLAGSALWSRGAARRLQDPLSIRNLPQVHGACLAALQTATEAAEDEINGASDNPGVIESRGEALSHGGYLTPHLQLALMTLNHAWSQLAAAQCARISKLLAARFTDLPQGLVAQGSEAAGLGPVTKTVEALWAEIAHLAAPPPIFPGVSADGLEDVSCHTAIAAKAGLDILDRLRRLTAIELIVAAQAVELRDLGDALAPALHPVLSRIRQHIPHLTEDIPLGAPIEALAADLPENA